MLASSAALRPCRRPPVLHDVLAIRDGLREAEVLLDEQDVKPWRLSCRSCGRSAARSRAQPLGRLASMRTAPRAQDAPDGSICCSRPRAAALALTRCGRFSEQLVDLVQAEPASAPRGSKQVLLHIELEKMPRSSGQNAMRGAR